MVNVAQLEPVVVWNHFAEILKIPRSSKKEEKIRDYIVNFAQSKQLGARVDKIGNVVVPVPASQGREEDPTLVLQSHMDMVCVQSPGKNIDFDLDAIPVRIEGDLLMGDGTTLGADNGIGMALMLALLDAPEISHGPLELLFTTDEEAGMTGAHNLEPGFIMGRKLINLDTEEWGEFYISCAGGGDIEITLPINRTELAASKNLFKLRVEGLKGGHSGIDINLGRGSAIKILARLLWHLNKAIGMDLVSISGGSKRNVIASEAEALFLSDEADEEQIKANLKPIEAACARELGSSDPDLKISLQVVESTATKRKMVHLSTEKVLDLLMALPHGVEAMSPDIPDLVETSCNVGVLKMDDHTINTVILARSALTSKVEALGDSIDALVKLAGGTVERPLGYPGWKPNPQSQLLAFAVEVYTKEFGSKPEVKAIHAGLECGIIGEKYPGIDMLSIGPDIRGAHTVGENVSIGSVQMFWRFLEALLNQTAD